MHRTSEVERGAERTVRGLNTSWEDGREARARSGTDGGVWKLLLLLLLRLDMDRRLRQHLRPKYVHI